MSAIARTAANNITTGGVFTSSAITNNSVTGITVLANAEDGITFISSQTASNSASISFTSGLTSTYKAYKFVFSNIHARTGGTEFSFQCSTNAGSTYATTITSTSFIAYHYESDAATDLAYVTADDQAQGTSFQRLIWNGSAGSGADESLSGSLQLFNPSSTTYVKHFISNINNLHGSAISVQNLYAGYANTTSAVNAVQFKMSSGNIDGTIYLYGIK
jgi:hypothetical protein